MEEDPRKGVGQTITEMGGSMNPKYSLSQPTPLPDHSKSWFYAVLLPSRYNNFKTEDLMEIGRNFNEKDLIDSPLSQPYTRDGKTVNIEIFRLPGTEWSLQVVDAHGNSTVYDDEFSTDNAALACVLHELNRDGIDAFIGAPLKS